MYIKLGLYPGTTQEEAAELRHFLLMAIGGGVSRSFQEIETVEVVDEERDKQ